MNDLHAMLKKHGDWMELGSDTVEAWGPFRGRFSMYIPPLLEVLELAELSIIQRIIALGQSNYAELTNHKSQITELNRWN